MRRQTTAAKLSRMTALVVDDQFTIRKAICRLLRHLGFGKVLDSPDGGSASKLLGTAPIDLVITDIFMPGTDGFQTIKNIRAQNFGADIPIIVVTGEGDRGEIVKAVDLGADDYILKPFQVEAIEKKVLSVLGHYQNPSPMTRLLREGDKLYLLGNFTDALKCFEAADRLNPASAQAKLGKALTLKKLGSTEQALDLLRSSSIMCPAFFKTFRALGDIAFELGFTTEAIEAIRHELMLNPKQPDRHILLGRMLKKECDLLGALNQYKIALGDSPKNKDALIESAKVLGELGHNEQAVGICQRARRFHPTWSEPMELAVSLLAKNGKISEAKTCLVSESRRQPKRADVRIMLSDLHNKENDITSALSVLDEGLANSPEDVRLLSAKASILKHHHQTEKSCKIYAKILKLEPTAKNQLQLAAALMQDRQFQAAIDLLSEPLENKTPELEPLLIIIEAMKNLGHSVQALHAVSLAETLAPTEQDSVKKKLSSLKDELKKLRTSQSIGFSTSLKKRAS